MSHLQLITVISSLLLVISSSGQYGKGEARSLSAAQFFPQSYAKRNSWWSKKSLDNLPINLKDNIISSSSSSSAQGGCESIMDVLKCYSSDCVTDFVSCTKNAETNDVYQMCKVEHGLCAAKCFGTDIHDGDD